MMQITDLKQEQQIPPFLRLGFRPFFLMGAGFSVIALIVWALLLRGNLNITPFGGNYWWHVHEMIFGFGCAIIAGFLLTAVQNWTGARGVAGSKLLGLLLLWLMARIFILFPQLFGNQLTSLVDLLFLPSVAYVLGKPIIAVKQYRNLFFIPLLLLFTVVNIQMHYAVYVPTSIAVQNTGYSAVLLITLLMSVMAGRVTPMFTANGTGTPKIVPIKTLEWLTNGSLAVALFSLLLQPVFGLNHAWFAVCLFLAGLCQAIRWLRWQPWITFAVPLLWSIHIAILFIWLGLLTLSLGYLFAQVPLNHAWHLLTIGGMAGLILAMISRVSLGHTGRPLCPPKVMSLAFLLISISALVRVFGPWLMPERAMLFIDMSIGCWLFAFGIFVLKYAPMLLTTRADNRPG
jgi:uncharacterized protein involved in response to NO